MRCLPNANVSRLDVVTALTMVVHEIIARSHLHAYARINLPRPIVNSPITQKRNTISLALNVDYERVEHSALVTIRLKHRRPVSFSHHNVGRIDVRVCAEEVVMATLQARIAYTVWTLWFPITRLPAEVAEYVRPSLVLLQQHYCCCW